MATNTTGFPPVLAWAFGWAVGLILPLVFSPLLGWDTPAARVVLPPMVGLVAFGFPAYVGVLDCGSRHPKIEALIWLAGSVLLAVVLMNYFEGLHGLAPPGTLNINTTETMRQRAEYNRTWHYPPQWVFTFKAGVVSGVALAVGMVLMLIAAATMILLIVSPFIGGAAVGTIIETAHGRLLTPRSA